MQKTMRQVVLEAALEALIRNEGNKTRSARDLMVSLRTMRNYAKELASKGYVVPRGDSGIGVRQLMVELDEFRKGLRKAPAYAKDYCSRCGRPHPCPPTPAVS